LMGKDMHLRKIPLALLVVTLLTPPLIMAVPARAAIITYVSSASARGNTVATLAVTKPAGVLVTDLMVAGVVINGGAAPTITAPAGWTLLQRTSATGISQAVYYKFATTAEPATYTWTFSANQRVVVGITAFEGVDIGSPVNASAAQANAASTSAIAPSVTATLPNTMLVGLFGVAARTAFTPPGGMTERYDRQTGSSGGNPPVTACGDTAAFAAVGATGTRTAVSGTAGINIGSLIALAPSTLDHFSVEASPGGGAIGTQTVNTPFNILITARDSSNAVIPSYNGTVNITSTGTLSSGGGTTAAFAGGQLTRSVTISNTGNFTITATDSAGTYRTGTTVVTGTSNTFTVSPTLASFRVEAAGGGAITTQAINSPFNIQVTALDGTGNTLTTFTGTVNITSTGTLSAGSGTTTNFVNGVLNPWSVTVSNAGTWTITATNTAGAQTGTSAPFTIATPAAFDAFDTDVPGGSITGPIRTKVTAAPYSLRLVALNAAKTAIDATFNKLVTVEVLGSTAAVIPVDAANCPVNNPDYTVLESQSATFVSGVVTVSFATTLNANNQNVWRSSRIRITNAGPPKSIACSGDVFAIRPASITVAVTDTDWQTAGAVRTLNNTVAAGGVVHKAGQPFTIKATASPATATNYTTGFTATPGVKNLACTLPATCSNGVLTPGAWSKSGSLAVQTTTASYSEAGALNLELEDRDFGTVDAGDPPPGLLTGSSTLYITPQSVIPIGVGRFVPNHFDATPNNTPVFKTFNATDAQCAPPVAPDTPRSFTYIGQPFGYLTLPQTLITARNAAGATTANYSGTLWKLATANVTETYADAGAPASLNSSLKGTPTAVSANDGTGTLTAAAAGVLSYTRTPLTPQATFNAGISLNVSAQDSSETGTAGNGTINTSTAALFNGGGTGIDFDSGDLFVFGQLQLDPAPGPAPSGPIDSPLTIPFWVEWYDDGVSGFFTNASDYCTPYTSAGISLSSYAGNLSAGQTTPGGSGKMIQGSYDSANPLYLSAPGAAHDGTVTVTYTPPAWLLSNGANPSVVATFTNPGFVTVLKWATTTGGVPMASAKPGQTIVYNIQVSNTGGSPVSNVSVSDALSQYTSLIMDAYGLPNTPIQFALGTSSVTPGTVTYSQNNGTDSYTYVPPASGPAPNVTNWKVPMNNQLKAGENFTLQYKSIIK
jgi:uncharacterized repeat protein (TIGR01451 family)